MIRIPLLSRPLIGKRTWSTIVDLVVFSSILAVFYGVLAIAKYWLGAAVPVSHISTSPRALPLYSFYSLVRIAVAYFLSLVFAVGYAYVAAYNERLQGLMIATLDILQSIPVLSFLPGVMLAMVALFPTKQLGLEMGAIVLIFTGQVWNMAFSFYSSLRSIPRDLREAARIYGLSRWQRFWELELPYGAIGLVWNSMISVAGGWFFLMVCEMFQLGKRDFRLPGLGSYLQTAASAGDTGAMLWGLAAMIAVIIAIDQLVWRPVIAWADRFKFEQTESVDAPRSPILHLLRNSKALIAIRQRTSEPLAEKLSLFFAARRKRTGGDEEKKANQPLAIVGAGAGAALVVYAAIHAIALLRGVTADEFVYVLKGAGATFLRVNVSLLIASAWAIPAGVAIGFSPKLARIAQPLTQIAASVPATALFPVFLLGLIKVGGGLGVGSILLMLLGTQWYILFNVIAGAMAIPSELREVTDLFRFSNLDRWRTLILPGILPYLVTGLVTASGGAWNASIVAEYFRFKDQVLSTIGLGAAISFATDSGRFNLLLLATIVMATLVVCINRLVWRPLYRLAETRYKLEA